MKRTVLFTLPGAALLAFIAISSFAANVPRKAPDIAVTLPDGKIARLSDTKGDVTVMLFLLSGCPHCQKCTAVVTGLMPELGPRGMRALGGIVNPDADIPAFVERFKPAFPVGAISNLTMRTAIQASDTTRMLMPAVMFVDRDGIVQSQYTGADDFLKDEASLEKNIRAEVLKILGESKSRSKTVGAR